MKFLERFDQINPRVIYLLMALALVLPVLKPIGMPIEVDNQLTLPVYEWVESLSPGDIVFFDASYGGGSDAELSPQLEAWLYHCFMKDVKVIGVAQWETGAQLSSNVCQKVAARAKADGYNAEYGTDWFFVGWRNMVWRAMIDDFWLTVGNQDFWGNHLSTLPLAAQVPKWDTEHTKGLIIFSAGSPGIPTYTTYWPDHDIYVGDVAVQVAGTSNYLRSGQVKGIIPGLRGAAEYEKLTGQPGLGTKLMDAQSVGHVIIILLVILGNISFFMKQGQKKAAA